MTSLVNPFEAPIKNDDLAAVQDLVKRGKDPKIPIGDGWPAIFWTGKYGSLPILKYLVEELGIDPKTQNKDGQTTILLSARYGNLDILRYLVEELDIDPFKRDKCEADCVLKAKHGQMTHILEYLNTPGCRIHLVKRRLAEFDEFGPKEKSEIQNMPEEMLRKSCFWEMFGYHWPTLDEIKAILKVITDNPLLSVGAGHAFTEHFLEIAGAKIVATDPLLSHFSQKPGFRPFMKVQKLTALDALEQHPDINMFMIVWPSDDDPWSGDFLEAVIRRMTPSTRIIFIGDQGQHQIIRLHFIYADYFISSFYLC